MEYVFGGAIFVAGYVLVCQAALQKVKGSKQAFAVLLVLFLLYCCLAGGIVVVALFIGDSGLIVYALMVLFTLLEAFSLLVVFRNIYRELERKKLRLFLLYVFAVLLMTVFTRETRQSYVLETNVLTPFLLAIKGKSMSGLYHIILNIILFMPVGYLFTQLRPQSLGTILQAAGFGCLLSTVIETSQLFFKLGNCDVGDILANTLGAVFGMLLFRFMANSKA